MANQGRIIKDCSSENYVQISNATIQSKDLSLPEKGLLAYLLSLPDDWVIYKNDLYSKLNDTKGSINKSFKGLQEKGFIVSKKLKSDKQRFIGWTHYVYSKSVLDTKQENLFNANSKIPASDIPKVEIPKVGNTPYIQRNNIQTNNTQTQQYKKYIEPDFEIFACYFITNGSNEETARKAYQYYSSMNWHDKYGKRISNWQSKAIAWINNAGKYNSPKNSLKMQIKPIEEKMPVMNDFYDYAAFEKALINWNKKQNLKLTI